MEFVDARIRSFRIELAQIKAGGGGVDEHGILIGFVFNQRGYRAVPVVAAFLAVFPDLLNSHLVLIDLIDHAAAVLHVGQRGLFERTAVTVVED